MPAVSIPSIPALPKPDDADFEPDDEWKRQLRKRIEESLESMVKDVKDNQAAQLRKQVVTEETRLRLEDEYKQAMVNIKTIASEQYRMELDRERNQRRWTAGKPINPEWTRILAEEQQSIMNTIKQNSNQDNPSPTDERRPMYATKPEKPTLLSSYESTTTALRSVPPIVPPPPPTPDFKEERDKHANITHDLPPPSAHRGSDTRGKHPRDRGDRPGSIRRQRVPSHSRSRHQADDPDSPDTADQSEELRPPLARTRTVVPDPLSLSENIPRWDASLGRTGSLRSAASFTARSPPKALPEVWKPATPLEDDPASAKSYHLGRRGSSASIKSTGSGASVRPTISATIPERIDDADDSGFTDRSNYEHERPRKFTDKDRRGGRKNSRPTPVDPTTYAEDLLLASTPLKSAAGGVGGGGSVVMQLATSSPGPIKTLSSKASFANGDDRYYRDHSARESPYREAPYSSRDTPLSSRPVPSRSTYSPDDRDHGGPYSHRPPKTPFREYPHHQPHTQSSYPLDERRRERDWDLDRDRERERERERDWDDEREYGRDREYDYRDRDWDRDRDNYADSRHQHPYPSRSATYPTPPSSVPRPPHDHHGNDLYEDREPPNRNYGYRGLAPPSSSPPDDWDYQRVESTRPVPTPQPYSRRDDPDRDQYARSYTSSSSIPIAPRHAPSSEDANGPAWKDWGVEARRLSESRYDGYPRSPPSAEPFPTRRRPQHYYNGNNNEGPLGRRRSRPPHLTDDSRRDHDYRRDKGGDRSDEEEEEEEEESSSGGGGDQSGSDGSDDELEEQTRRLEAERRQTDRRIREKALEIRRLQEEEQRLEDEAKRKEEEVKRREEEVRRRDEEARKTEQELQRVAEEAKRTAEEEHKEHKKKEETRRKEREMKRKEQDANRKIEDANKLVIEAGRKAEEARKKEDEVNRKEEQTRRKEEKLREDAEKTLRMQQEANRIAEQARLKQESLRQMEEETRRKEQEIEERERALKAREDELKRREEEARRLREEARRLEEEAWRKEEEARRKEAEVRRKEQEARKKEDDMRRKEEEARKKEEDSRRKEEARKREEEAASRMREERHRRESDMKRVDTDRFFEEGHLEDVDSRFVEEQARLLQQAQYRKREEEIRRSREERKRQDSIGNDSAWTSSSTSPGVSKTFPQFANTQVPQYSSPSPAPGSTSAAWTTWGAHSTKPPNTTASSPTSGRPASSVPPLNKPRNGSISSGSHPTSASPHPATPISESEWARRHAEFTNDQQERFRREQERMEAERQLRAAGKPLSRDEIQRIFEHHDRLWSRLPGITELSWVDFPWPVLRPPSYPDEISFVLVNAYFSVPFLPEKEKAKSLKDRIKEHLRRWHPDRFDSKVLPRVLDAEKEKVKQGAGNVVRYLNDLLRKENETGNNTSNLFGE